jgi:hypothetical protein
MFLAPRVKTSFPELKVEYKLRADQGPSLFEATFADGKTLSLQIDALKRQQVVQSIDTAVKVRGRCCCNYTKLGHSYAGSDRASERNASSPLSQTPPRALISYPALHLAHSYYYCLLSLCRRICNSGSY